MPDTNFTVSNSAITTLMQAVQQNLNNKQAANQLLATSDQQLVAAWQAFERALVPVAEQAPMPALVPATDAQ